MPVLVFLAAVGLALIVLLFVADAQLESVSPIVTSERVGLPKQWHPGKSEAPAELAPVLDMASRAGGAAQPKSEPEAKIDPEARAARAEAPPKKRATWQPVDQREGRFRQNNASAADRFSIGGQ